MTRDEIKSDILRLFTEEFEIEAPGLDDDLGIMHAFDSIDAIDLLREIEIMLDTELSIDEKDQAMTLRTINQILDYIELLSATRNK